MNSASALTTPVVSTGPLDACAGLLSHLGIPHVEEPSSDAFVLVEGEAGLELRPPGELDRPGIRAHFPPDSKGQTASSRSPLAKAFGKKVTQVFDLTAGLGGDAYRLAAAGYRVRAWERHPAVFALLTSGWGASVARGQVPADLIERLSFQWGEGKRALAEFASGANGAYFDPMYPAPRRSSALPKRPLQVLRELLRGEDEPVELVTAALERLARVVVKRPHHAPSLVPGASFAVETKLVRFDVYLNPARMEAPGE